MQENSRLDAGEVSAFVIDESSLDGVRDRERAHFDRRYVWTSDLAPPPDTPATFLPCITPEYEEGGVPGGFVHRELWKRLIAEGLEGRNVLDYASGAGHWGIRLAQEGAHVRGFDLSPEGVTRSNRRADVAAVDATFVCADAGHLPYEDESFDLVVCIRALHHTVKYPGTAEELHRVMRPGARAYCAENIDGWWGLRLARRWTMRHEKEAGDVILTGGMIREWAGMFRRVEIARYHFLLMARRLGLPRRALVGLHAIDSVLLKVAPVTRRLCGDCLIVLEK